MIKKGLMVLILGCMCLFSKAQTSSIMVHDGTHLNTNGQFYKDGYFPNMVKSYSKIILDLKLFCPDNGCSNWDYTIKIFLGKKGEKDTVYYELGRMMTPYGGDYNWFEKAKTWKQHYFFDITDYAPLLRDSVIILVRYEGWQDGFKVSTTFNFWEDQTEKILPIKVEQIYLGYFRYGIADRPIETFLPKKQFVIPEGTERIYVKTIISGHGADSIQYCSEFCNKYYDLEVDGKPFARRNIWRNDCGKNPIQPQGGTWIYNRAGWCPGSKTDEHYFDITEWVKEKGNFELSLNFEKDTIYQQGQAGYSVSCLLFYTKLPEKKELAVLDEILSPNPNYTLYIQKPICHEPEIVISNMGRNTMTQCVITAQTGNGSTFHYTWKGNLKYMQKDTVILPFYFTLEDIQSKTLTFTVTNMEGKYSKAILPMQTGETIFPIIDVLPQNAVFQLVTNDSCRENSLYVITNLPKEHDNYHYLIPLTNNFTPRQTYDFKPKFDNGCYQFVIQDEKCNGISWWANPSQGNGIVRIVNGKTGELLKTFDPDFGCELRYNFFVNTQTEDLQRTSAEVHLMRSPFARDYILDIYASQIQDINIIVFDKDSNIVVTQNYPMTKTKTATINSAEWEEGVYRIQVKVGDQTIEKRIRIRARRNN